MSGTDPNVTVCEELKRRDLGEIAPGALAEALHATGLTLVPRTDGDGADHERRLRDAAAGSAE